MAFFGTGGASVANMVGATSSAAGTAGLVPQPAAGNQGKALIGDGTFSFAVFPSGGNYGTDYVGWPTLTYIGSNSLTARTTSSDYIIRGGMFFPKGTYNRIGLYISTAATGGNKNCKIGIYDTDSSGKPSSIVASGTLNCDNVGVSEASVNDFTLDSKFYYTAYIFQATTGVWMCNFQVNPCIPWNTFTGIGLNYGIGNNMFSAGGYAANNYSTGLPSSLSTSAPSQDVNTWVFVRKV